MDKDKKIRMAMEDSSNSSSSSNNNNNSSLLKSSNSRNHKFKRVLYNLKLAKIKQRQIQAVLSIAKEILLLKAEDFLLLLKI